MGRLSYTIKQSFYQRKKLKAVKQKKYQLSVVTDLNIDQLKKHHIKYLALDFDGVLAAHGQALPNENIKIWLQQFSDKFNQNHIFILSNKPTDMRAQYFKSYFPNICFISGVNKKPYPDGLLAIQQMTKCQAHELALVDDRLLTGCLACILAGSFPILITKPCKNYRKRPFQEAFFGFLRKLEQGIFLA